MAPMNASLDSQSASDRAAWNEAYDRLRNFLDAFRLSDHAEVSRLALKFLDEAQEFHRQNPATHPTTQAMEQVQKKLVDWLAANLEEQDKVTSQVFSTGCVALLLSRMGQMSPGAFLVTPLPEDLRQSMRQTLLITGPDLHVSSMTPRPLDYGPMLDLARQTWHRWNGRDFLFALLFWVAVYFAFYWWLSDLL